MSKLTDIERDVLIDTIRNLCSPAKITKDKSRYKECISKMKGCVNALYNDTFQGESAK